MSWVPVVHNPQTFKLRAADDRSWEEEEEERDLGSSISCQGAGTATVPRRTLCILSVYALKISGSSPPKFRVHETQTQGWSRSRLAILVFEIDKLCHDCFLAKHLPWQNKQSWLSLDPFQCSLTKKPSVSCPTVFTSPWLMRVRACPAPAPSTWH